MLNAHPYFIVMVTTCIGIQEAQKVGFTLLLTVKMAKAGCIDVSGESVLFKERLGHLHGFFWVLEQPKDVCSLLLQKWQRTSLTIQGPRYSVVDPLDQHLLHLGLSYVLEDDD